MANNTRYQFIGFGHKSIMMSTKLDFRKLDSSLVNYNFQNAKSRLIVISLDGIGSNGEKKRLLLNALDRLSRQATVYVIS